MVPNTGTINPYTPGPPSLRSVTVRLLLDRAGDNDRKQDLVAFFIADSNTNQPGIFVLEVKVDPGS